MKWTHQPIFVGDSGRVLQTTPQAEWLEFRKKASDAGQHPLVPDFSKQVCELEWLDDDSHDNIEHPYITPHLWLILDPVLVELHCEMACVLMI